MDFAQIDVEMPGQRETFSSSDRLLTRAALSRIQSRDRQGADGAKVFKRDTRRGSFESLLSEAKPQVKSNLPRTV